MYKQGVLNQPLVNQYADLLADVLQEMNPGMEIKKPAYRFINSVDIDNAYAFLGKGLVRTFGRLCQRCGKHEVQ
ncbi:MAG: hypothetical protein U5L96_10395 [Owenweeksia sp.]|nr:hypothetical protein [Owenweeksia sp.]